MRPDAHLNGSRLVINFTENLNNSVPKAALTGNSPNIPFLLSKVHPKPHLEPCPVSMMELFLQK